MLHISDPNSTPNNPNDKIFKVRPLLDYIEEKSKMLFQPYQNVSVDERMVRCKGRSGIRQFIPNKPVRFGIKLWCLCCPLTGYTYSFSVYGGRKQAASENGIAYDAVTGLAENLRDQGYHLYFDNFFTSVALVLSLLTMGLLCCGTMRENKKGIPPVLKDKEWQKNAKRGNMRFIRDGNLLHMQWRDNKVQWLLLMFTVLV